MKWKELRKIGVSGSRKFYKPDLATQFIDKYIVDNFKSISDVVIVTGHDVGLDATVELYCMRRGIKNLIIHGRWLELVNSAAEPERNQNIVDLCNEMFFFWDGVSSKDVLKRTKVKGIPYRFFTLKSLTKELGVKPIPTIVLPESRKINGDISKRDVHKIRSLVKAADMDDLIVTKKPKRKSSDNYFS